MRRRHAVQATRCVGDRALLGVAGFLAPGFLVQLAGVALGRVAGASLNPLFAAWNRVVRTLSSNTAAGALSGRADLHPHRATPTASLRYASCWSIWRAIRRSMWWRSLTTTQSKVRSRPCSTCRAVLWSAGDDFGEKFARAEGHILGLFLEQRVPSGLSGTETVAPGSARRAGWQSPRTRSCVPFSRLDDGSRVRMGVGAALRRIPFDGMGTRHGLGPWPGANTAPAVSTLGAVGCPNRATGCPRQGGGQYGLHPFRRAHGAGLRCSRRG